MKISIYVLHRAGQKGAALIVSMVMLVVITIVGVTVMGGSRLEWLMANNSYFQTSAFMNAETALQAGLATLPSTVTPIMPTNPPLAVDATDVANWDSGAIASTPAGTNGAYAVEYLGCSSYIDTPNGKHYFPCPLGTMYVYTYRVWAVGRDAKGSVRILNSTHIVSDAPLNQPPNPAVQQKRIATL